MVYVFKKNNKDNTDSLIKKFTRKVQQSGVLMEVRKGRFEVGKESKTKRRKKALYNKKMKKEVDKLKKMGRFNPETFKELKVKVKKENV